MGIGFETTVRRTDSSTAIARWRGTSLPDWLTELIASGTAVVVESTGGCPDRYRSPAAAVLPHLPAVGECEADDTLEITVWDQS